MLEAQPGRLFRRHSLAAHTALIPTKRSYWCVTKLGLQPWIIRSELASRQATHGRCLMIIADGRAARHRVFCNFQSTLHAKSIALHTPCGTYMPHQYQ